MASSSGPPRKSLPSEVSHLTLLRPRQSAAADSIPYDMTFIRSSLEIDRERWRDRKDFFCTTLSFCLSLANLWRFPRQAYMYGQGTFVLLYIIFTTLFGSSLLFFEVALGQYSSVGFTRVFAACPLFEGVSYSMCLYCAVCSMAYNLLNSVSFIYVFASLEPTLDYAVCNTSQELICDPNSTNEAEWPEFVFYNNTISDRDEQFAAGFSANWRNIGILFLLWVLISIAIVAGIRTTPWPYMIHCPSLFLVLVTTLIITLTHSGSTDGLIKFVLPDMNGIYNIKTWAYAFEQMVVTFGLGMGPLINFASYINFECPVHKDTALLCFIVVINSLLAGLIFFCSLGVIAYDKSIPVDALFDMGNRGESPPVHAVFSHIFTKLPDIASQFMSFTFFCVFFFTGWLSLIHYAETIVTGIYESGFLQYKFKITFNIAVCIVLFLVGLMCETIDELKNVIHGAEYFIGTSVLIILLTELVSIIYIYGLYNFCDEIQFMLGTFPNYYYQITWFTGPIILLLLIIFFIYTFVVYQVHMFHLIFICIFIILPILLRAVYNTVVFAKRGVLSQILFPRLFTVGSSEDFDTDW